MVVPNGFNNGIQGGATAAVRTNAKPQYFNPKALGALDSRLQFSEVGSSRKPEEKSPKDSGSNDSGAKFSTNNNCNGVKSAKDASNGAQRPVVAGTNNREKDNVPSFNPNSMHRFTAAKLPKIR